MDANNPRETPETKSHPPERRGHEQVAPVGVHQHQRDDLGFERDGDHLDDRLEELAQVAGQLGDSQRYPGKQRRLKHEYRIHGMRKSVNALLLMGSHRLPPNAKGLPEYINGCVPIPFHRG